MKWIAFVLACAALGAGSARAEAQEQAIVEPPALTVRDVLHRVRTLDPLARKAVIAELRASVDLRRARWSRVAGSVGLDARETAIATNLGATNGAPADSTLSTSVNVAANVVVPLYAGGGIDGAIRAAAASLDAARSDEERIVRDLQRVALTAYARVVATEELLRVAEAALARGTGLVDSATKRRESGIGSEAEVARAELNRVRLAEDVAAARGEVSVAKSALRAALALDLAPGDGTTAPGTSEPSPAASLDDLARMAPRGVASRPDRDAAIARAHAADARRTVAYAGYLPRLELFGTALYGNNPTALLGNNFIPGSMGDFGGAFTTGARVTWTAWDIGITRDAVARAEADRESATYDVADTTRQVQREVGDARAREVQARSRLDALAGSGTAAQRAITLARARYDAGMSTLVEVLDAELEAVRVEARRVQAAFDLAVAHVDALRAEGYRYDG